MEYRLFYSNAEQHYLTIELKVKIENQETSVFQFPAWRPGRYELGNFAKNVRNWQAFGLSNEILESQKTSKDAWEINVQGQSEILIRYNYYSNEINAGSTYLGDEMLYVNPVNCCGYIIGRDLEKLSLKIDVPESYEIAGALNGTGNQFEFENFHELVDTPFIASDSLIKQEFEVDQTHFILWYQGPSKPDFDKIEKDIVAYTEAQFKVFDDFPSREYHYLFLTPAFKAYHGVEHQHSTVISLGPGYELMKGNYDSFLGVSSHELYHTWNVKALRPLEMQPYDYSKENHTELGYVAEGVTTYMGDLMLLRGGVFSLEKYLTKLSKQVQAHFNNFGRLNYSVAESSWDTWLDGYVAGAPGRKVSIYNEGALLALSLDILLRLDTSNVSSLHTVMNQLYVNFGKTGRGYSAEDYQKTIEEVSGKSYQDFFDKYYRSTGDYLLLLEEVLVKVGLEIIEKKSVKVEAASLGIQLINKGKNQEVNSIFPKSLAEEIGLSIGDTLLSINDYSVNNDFSDLLEYYKSDKIALTVVRNGQILLKEFSLGEDVYYKEFEVCVNSKATASQILLRNSWMDA